MLFFFGGHLLPLFFDQTENSVIFGVVVSSTTITMVAIAVAVAKTDATILHLQFACMRVFEVHGCSQTILCKRMPFKTSIDAFFMHLMCMFRCVRLSVSVVCV